MQGMLISLPSFDAYNFMKLKKMNINLYFMIAVHVIAGVDTLMTRDICFYTNGYLK